jgi:glycosyltransferase involved in cell wall biosynthesis
VISLSDGRFQQNEGPPSSRESVVVPSPARRLDFDVVIATRNRPAALALSIPLILRQSRLPRKLIVIDSSDDHASAAEAVAEAVAGTSWSGIVIVEHASPGLTRQRNRGLAHVESEIVFFPDDDSLFHPGTSEAIMRVYERDAEGRIAAVCAAPSADPPPGALQDARYQTARAPGLRDRIGRHLRSLERYLEATSPTTYLGKLLMARHERPGWLDEEDCVLVEHMTGYRMTFRTAVIRAEGFDEALAAYAVNEDRDASFGAMRHGCLAAALKGRIYHHKFPSGRGDPYTLGMMQVLNRCYITLKHVRDADLALAEAREVRRRVRRLCRRKVLTSLPSIYRQSGREQLRGVLAALDGVRAMLDARREDLPRIYSETQDRILAVRERSRQR